MVSEKLTCVRAHRAGQISRVLWITLILNWSVAALKIVLGTATQCMVITADGLHSFTDGTSNILGLIAITISGHPPDKDHPYGHQKFETLASVGIAFFLFIVSLGIFREAINALIHPRTPEITVLSFAVMGFTLMVNLFVVWYERKKGKELQSDFLVGDSWHTMTDVFVTLSVFVAMIGIAAHVPHLDAIFSLVIVGIILLTALKILKRGSEVLVDKAVVESEAIEKLVRSVDGVRDCHEIRTRGRKDDIYVDLHVLVDSEMTVRKSHHLSNIIEKQIKAQIPGVNDVVVHIEPVSHEHDEGEV